MTLYLTCITSCFCLVRTLFLQTNLIKSSNIYRLNIVIKYIVYICLSLSKFGVFFVFVSCCCCSMDDMMIKKKQHLLGQMTQQQTIGLKQKRRRYAQKSSLLSVNPRAFLNKKKGVRVNLHDPYVIFARVHTMLLLFGTQ